MVKCDNLCNTKGADGKIYTEIVASIVNPDEDQIFKQILQLRRHKPAGFAFDGLRFRNIAKWTKAKGMNNVFAIGDQSLVEGDEEWPKGHPQLAQVAIQQADNVAKNILGELSGKEPKPFTYRNLGTMATIGRRKAVAEIGKMKWGGFSAWILWLVVHLRSILGVKNKTVVFLNWVWNYFNYRQSLRLILKPVVKKDSEL